MGIEISQDKIQELKNEAWGSVKKEFTDRIENVGDISTPLREKLNLLHPKIEYAITQEISNTQRLIESDIEKARSETTEYRDANIQMMKARQCKEHQLKGAKQTWGRRYDEGALISQISDYYRADLMRRFYNYCLSELNRLEQIELVIKLQNNPKLKEHMSRLEDNTVQTITRTNQHTEAQKAEPEKTKGTILKDPDVKDYSKPELTQKEMMILFKVMKEKRTITYSDIENTQYAKLIHYLTGYSENTCRQDLSKEFAVISDKEDTYNKIIEKLETLITSLNQVKNEVKGK